MKEENTNLKTFKQPRLKNLLLKVLAVLVIVPLLYLMIGAIRYVCPEEMGGMIYGGIFYLAFAIFLIQLMITVLRRRVVCKLDVGLLLLDVVILVFYYFSTWPHCIW